MIFQDNVPEDLISADNGWEDYFKDFLSGGSGVKFGVTMSRYAVLSEIFSQSPVGFIVVSEEGRVLFINSLASEMLDYDREMDADIMWNKLRRKKQMRGVDDIEIREDQDPLNMAISQKFRTTSNIMLKDPLTGADDWVSMTACPVFADKERTELVGGIASLIDITDYKGMQDILYHQATHDPLTGLANKAFLSSSMMKAFARAKRGGSGGAVLFLDVDKFKRVNDALGHSAGDALLAKIAERLCSEVRETDIVARVGGDEFIVLLSDIENVADLRVAGDVAERICRSVSKPYVIRGDEVYVSISVGISLYPQDGLDEESILARADEAMYKVKETGRNGWSFYKDPPNLIK